MVVLLRRRAGIALRHHWAAGADRDHCGGATSVTCLTPSQAANFTVGGSAVVMSLDIQYYGYPPCCDQFDFVTVTAVNASTGVVTFANDSLRYIHRADFPDGPPTGGSGGNIPCGKARIWPLDSTQNNDARGALPCPWNVSHIYRGITINQLIRRLHLHVNRVAAA